MKRVAIALAIALAAYGTLVPKVGAQSLWSEPAPESGTWELSNDSSPTFYSGGLTGSLETHDGFRYEGDNVGHGGYLKTDIYSNRLELDDGRVFTPSSPGVWTNTNDVRDSMIVQ